MLPLDAIFAGENNPHPDPPPAWGRGIFFRPERSTMTPFGRKLRSLRAARRCQLKDLAKALKVSSAYLSALEHGHRGKPSPGLVQQVAAYFNLAWEQVDELKALAELSDPRVTIDTAGLSPEATELANRLAARIGALSDGEIARLLAPLKTKH